MENHERRSDESNEGGNREQSSPVVKSLGEIGCHLNIPNFVTISRLLLGLAAAGLVYAVEIPHRFEVAASGLALATALDLIDGFLARRFDSVTRFGAVLDPLVDKIIANVFFCVLVYEGVFEWWLVVLAFARDVAVQVGRIRAASFGIVVRTFRVSDVRNSIQIIAVLAGLLSLSPAANNFIVFAWIPSLAEIATMLFVIGLALGYIGTVVFFSAYWRLSQTRKSRHEK
jgi:CDP-diacylglycerol--glycerol-3-phosphate 3-phosphatidyltransferase